ncbi:hypothetical protein BJY24_003779 [Nocardia transvalensis]|uniref:Uncharacterized protein n=1 Tax=Nocardia transvalensis TaxID=37333 RepID=A0A7W9UJ62_9NOCA|nr:hypothetical protein [Nocardia transvalensis]MBB5914912.1 hypothetical protein [Nocardia transvalensis]
MGDEQAQAIHLLSGLKPETKAATEERIRNASSAAIHDVHFWCMNPDGDLLLFSAGQKFITYRYFQAIDGHTTEKLTPALGAEYPDDPAACCTQAVSWRDPQGQYWAKLGMFPAFRCKNSDVALEVLIKKAKKLTEKARRSQQKAQAHQASLPASGQRPETRSTEPPAAGQE